MLPRPCKTILSPHRKICLIRRIYSAEKIWMFCLICWNLRSLQRCLANYSQVDFNRNHNMKYMLFMWKGSCLINKSLLFHSTYYVFFLYILTFFVVNDTLLSKGSSSQLYLQQDRQFGEHSHPACWQGASLNFLGSKTFIIPANTVLTGIIRVFFVTYKTVSIG